MNDMQITSNIVLGTLSEEIGGKSVQNAQMRAENALLKRDLEQANARIAELEKLNPKGEKE